MFSTVQSTSMAPVHYYFTARVLDCSKHQHGTCSLLFYSTCSRLLKAPAWHLFTIVLQHVFSTVQSTSMASVHYCFTARVLDCSKHQHGICSLLFYSTCSRLFRTPAWHLFTIISQHVIATDQYTSMTPVHYYFTVHVRDWSEHQHVTCSLLFYSTCSRLIRAPAWHLFTIILQHMFAPVQNTSTALVHRSTEGL